MKPPSRDGVTPTDGAAWPRRHGPTGRPGGEDNRCRHKQSGVKASIILLGPQMFPLKCRNVTFHRAAE